jgi:hypothetical protein
MLPLCQFQAKEGMPEPRKQAHRAKPGLHLHKTMLCLWQDMEGIIHYELLERNLTVTAERLLSASSTSGGSNPEKHPV